MEFASRQCWKMILAARAKYSKKQLKMSTSRWKIEVFVWIKIIGHLSNGICIFCWKMILAGRGEKCDVIRELRRSWGQAATKKQEAVWPRDLFQSSAQASLCIITAASQFSPGNSTKQESLGKRNFILNSSLSDWKVDLKMAEFLS